MKKVHEENGKNPCGFLFQQLAHENIRFHSVLLADESDSKSHFKFAPNINITIELPNNSKKIKKNLAFAD